MERMDLRELALKKVKIKGRVIGKFGTFEIEQVYRNNTKDVVEVGYTFPIVETATVIGFEIHVGDKVLKGKCKEKGAAKKEYQRNLAEGNSAYLMEQETDNIFKIFVGKIDKDEEVTVKIYYIDKFEITDNTIEILIPTLVTPKYKSHITSNLKYGKVDYTVDFELFIDKSLNRKSIYCPSHEIKVIDGENAEIVEVSNYDLSKDFKLMIALKQELSSHAILSKTRDGKDMIYLSFMPEILDSYEDSEKEYLFIIDVSGSMMGRKLEETKNAVIECLKQLDEGDKFNLIPFESGFEAMNIESIGYNEENRKKAIEYINTLEPLGGTEILNPLRFALYEKNVDKTILLFTDGQVGNEREIIKYVEENINSSRIFPFGIDSNVNSAFIKQLARVGNGKAEFIQPKEKIDDKIIRTFARIQTPLLENVEINYGRNNMIDEIREENCLFNYEFFNVFAKLERLEDEIELSGFISGKEYTWKIRKEEIEKTEVDLEVLFAKEQMTKLEEKMRNTYDAEEIENDKKKIIELSIKYNINSKYTSFLTVYERKNKLSEVPKYQETRLSDNFAKEAIMDKVCVLLGMNDYEECLDENWGATTMDVKTGGYHFNTLDIPCFLRRNKKESRPHKIQKSEIEIAKEKVEEYYKIFIAKKEKSMLTYLLYAIYYLKNRDSNFNYMELIIFLKEQKEIIAEKEEYMKLLYLCYSLLKPSRTNERKETLELLGERYKKIVVTNLKVKINFKEITQKDVEDIVKNDKIVENINDMLWYLCDEKRTAKNDLGWIK